MKLVIVITFAVIALWYLDFRARKAAEAERRLRDWVQGRGPKPRSVPAWMEKTL